MPHTFAVHDVVVFTTKPQTGRTWWVTELEPSPAAGDAPLVRIWPTDPNDAQMGRWVGSDLLRLSDRCPQHCPLCGIDLKAEGYPIGHKTDEGNQCEWQWDEPDAVDQPANGRPCTGGCGLAAAPGDVFCDGCRDGHERDRTYDDPDRLAGP